MTNESPKTGPVPDLSDEELARATLRAVCVDPTAPAAAKAQAGRTLLELNGKLGRHAEAPRDDATGSLAEASVDDLRGMLAALRKDR